MGTFVGRKKRKVWPWLAVERASRRLVAWGLDRRGAATARRLWAALPARYRGPRCWSFTDSWQAYAGVLPRGPPRPCPKGEGQTRIVEAINCSWRQRCSAWVRISCSFSKKLTMHTARSKIAIDNYNLTLG